MGSSNPDPRTTRAQFEGFVRRILAVPKRDLDARLAEERQRKGPRAKRPPRA